jgi:glycosyltransferase involved in cell wall biosynthesis
MRFFIRLCLLFICFSVSAQQTLAIFTGKTQVGAWDPDSIKKGITGSEEAIIYISQKLAQLGYQVTVFGDPPAHSPYTHETCNPRYVPIEFPYSAPFDIGISWRMPQVAPQLKRWAKKIFFWPHDLCTSYLTTDLILGFDDVLWISQSQRRHWISLNPPFARFTHIFGNGINPEQFPEIQERQNPYSCIYASSYARGLSVLLDIWPLVKKQYPRATLDIYYGWQTWGALPPSEEHRMRAQINSLRFLGVQEHGMVGHEELNRAYAQASFWTYPCTALDAETFCISALRAQFSGAVPVIIDGSALVETVRSGFKCSHPNQYLTTLLLAMQRAEEITLQQRRDQRAFILQNYTWEVMAKKWQALFDAHLSQ